MTTETRHEVDLDRYLPEMPAKLRPGFRPPVLTIPYSVFEAAQRIARERWLARQMERLFNSEAERVTPHPAQLCHLDDGLIQRAKAALGGLRQRHASLGTLSQHFLELAALGSADVTVVQAQDAIEVAERRCQGIDAREESAARAEAAKTLVRGLPRPAGVIPPHFAPPDGETVRLSAEQVEELHSWWERFTNSTKGQLPACPFEIIQE